MKIRPPKYPNKKSDKFLARKAAEAEKLSKAAPESGDIKIFLDDERECPKGWVLARNPAEFTDLIEDAENGRITEISLDWYLGAGIADGVAVAKYLSELMNSDTERFKSLECIRFHSSDQEKAAEMMRTIIDPYRDKGEMPDFAIDFGVPREETFSRSRF